MEGREFVREKVRKEGMAKNWVWRSTGGSKAVCGGIEGGKEECRQGVKVKGNMHGGREGEMKRMRITGEKKRENERGREKMKERKEKDG